MLRYLRLFSAVTCFVLCALFVVFWMRSFNWWERTAVATANGSVCVASMSGKLLLFALSEFVTMVGPDKTVESWPAKKGENPWMEGKPVLGVFVLESDPDSTKIIVPYWFPTLVTGAAGLLLWMKRPYRFTVRGALIATTLIAVALGLGVATSR